MTIVTTGMVRDIRRRRMERETIKSIAADLGISSWTCWKYASEENYATARAWERRRYRNAPPEVLERKRTQAREWARKARAEGRI